MRVDSLGIPIFSADDIFNLIYQGNVNALEKILAEPSADINEFNLNSDTITIKQYNPLDISQTTFDEAMQRNWFMPNEYKNMDIEGFLVSICPKQNYQRLIEELQEFRARNMLDLLRWLKYFVDTCRANNVVWGVGRGSSVASYVLFLLGVHRIDSIKYNLDWQEFLR